MGTRILTTDTHHNNEQGAVLFDSETEWAFGPVFESGEMAEAFIQWLRMGDGGLSVRPAEAEDLDNGDLGWAHTRFVDVWKYCGLSDEERKLYDEYESDKTAAHWASPNRIIHRDERLQQLMYKVEDVREERWKL